MRFRLFILLVSFSASVTASLYESEPINYYESKAVDSVSSFFSTDVESWEREGNSGYLTNFLATFDIPKESQVLVYSKTSLQVSHIRPENPRAIYFNKDIYVGWVPGAEMLEIIASSPTTANNFYTISNYSDRPKLIRENHDCLSCHGGSFTRDIPAPLVRSVFPDNTGQPIFKAGTRVVDHTTPYNDRRGGWFVTGGPNSHYGNKVFTETDRGADSGILFDKADIRDNGYLMKGSDTVALLILEHQSELHRLIAHLALQTKTALFSQKKFDELLGRTERLSESTKRQIKSVADKLLKYMFFKDEAEIHGIKLERSPYAKYFNGNGPKDSRGRSLYDLKMDGRMFTYPFSYMVYSDAFQHLPEEATEYIKQELTLILDPDNEYEGFDFLSKSDKTTIAQILEETTDLL
jgi:hypothetical protein